MLPTRFVEFDPAGFPRVACFDNVCHVTDHPGMGCVTDSERPVALSLYDSFGYTFVYIREHTV